MTQPKNIMYFSDRSDNTNSLILHVFVLYKINYQSRGIGDKWVVLDEYGKKGLLVIRFYEILVNFFHDIEDYKYMIIIFCDCAKFCRLNIILQEIKWMVERINF